MQMTSSALPNTRSKSRGVSRNRAARIAISAACLLTVSGCAPNNVVTQVVALPAIAPALMAYPVPPKCSLQQRTEYDAREVLAYANCYKAAYHALAGRLSGLQKAVATRELHQAKAVRASAL